MVAQREPGATDSRCRAPRGRACHALPMPPSRCSAGLHATRRRAAKAASQLEACVRSAEYFQPGPDVFRSLTSMQTQLDPTFKDPPAGREADEVLRTCVHCGFCLATCPTYQLLGDELDSPRGRIYLMKQMLEGQPVTRKTQLHLDRCLTCRACETTCQSGVQYGRLLDIGRALTEERVTRSRASLLKRYLLRKIVPHTRRVRAL